MRIIKNWDNDRKEVFRGIPVACPICEAEVSITGYLEDGELRLEDCPSCGRPFSLVVIDTELDEAPQPIQFLAKATVIWFLDGGAIPQASATIGPTTNVLDLLSTVLNNGIQFYKPGQQALLRASMARLILENWLTADDARALMKLVSDNLDSRPTIVDATTPEANNPVLNLYDKPNPKSGPADKEEVEDDEE